MKKARLNSSKPAAREPPSESESSDYSSSESVHEDVSESEIEVSESENESLSESDNLSESESENEAAPQRKDKFATAIEAILNSKVKAHDQENPILIRNKRPAREIVEAKEDARARKALRAERLHSKDKARVRDVIPKDPELAGDVIANEKRLRKIAQRGVVRLMNAINAAQSAAEKEPGEESVDLSKEKFLDMLRAS